jgi:hypothetical protein
VIGCKSPVLLRAHQDGYLLVGRAWIEGYMTGESVAGIEQGAKSVGELSDVLIY